MGSRTKMNKYSVRVIEKLADHRNRISYTYDVINILVSARDKKSARNNLRKIDGGKYANTVRYRIGRVTQVNSWNEEDGFSIPIKEASFRKHWEI